MKKYDLYSRRDPAKNFSPLPNEVFYLDLSYGAIAIYGYLMHIEDRKTFQSYASYNTIGRAVKMSANTVRKYVLELEDKCLIRTEPTTVVTRDGRKRNGTLRYYIRPIQEAVDHYYERQRAQARLSRLCAVQEPLPAAGRPMNLQQQSAACRGRAARCAERVTSALETTNVLWQRCMRQHCSPFPSPVSFGWRCCFFQDKSWQRLAERKKCSKSVLPACVSTSASRLYWGSSCWQRHSSSLSTVLLRLLS